MLFRSVHQQAVQAYVIAIAADTRARTFVRLFLQYSRRRLDKSIQTMSRPRTATVRPITSAGAQTASARPITSGGRQGAVQRDELEESQDKRSCCESTDTGSDSESSGYQPPEEDEDDDVFAFAPRKYDLFLYRNRLKGRLTPMRCSRR